jgi:ribosomal protein L7/L12
MMGLGWIELLVILGFVALFVLFVAIVMLAVRSGGMSSRSLGWRSDGLPPPISADLYEQLEDLVRHNRKIEAIRRVRHATGAGLKEAKAAVDAIAAGTYTLATREDLAARVRALKAGGRAEQAVLLVRGETGMSQAEAETFVEAIG